MIVVSHIKAKTPDGNSGTVGTSGEWRIIPDPNGTTNSTIFEQFSGTYSTMGIEPPIIQRVEGVLGGSAKIRKTRIAVWMLVRLRDQLKMVDADIKGHYDPPLTDEDLAAAWRYYDEHKQEIDADIHRNEAE
jgi:uncharacterized protein (DUF433 family)